MSQHSEAISPPAAQPRSLDLAQLKQDLLRPNVLGPLLLVVGLILWFTWDSLVELASIWSTQADYSHGFLVPVFSCYLLWHRRDLITPLPTSGSWWGLALLVLGGGMRWASGWLFYPLLDAPSLLPTLAGIALLLGGWRALKWSWPAIVFLMFMIPLPGFVANRLAGPLQRIATISSTWVLQTCGVPAIAKGNIISLSNGEIGVVEACSGLRMLMLFLAITVGASFLVRRPLWEKIAISLSALVIAVIANVTRITVTAILHEYVSKELAQTIFHDLAGWLMMPLATALLFLELYLLSRLLIEPERRHDPVVLRR